MLFKFKNLVGVDVFLEKTKTRVYVGQLYRKDSNYIFTYDDAYLYNERSISLGPDLPLTTKTFTSNVLFPTFEDRIPSRKNPAYIEYCEMVGINPLENDVLILLATLGQKGPSSFIFAPAYSDGINSADVINFRKMLNLTIREFSAIFDFSTKTINKIEHSKICGKETLKRLEIYINFPEVALYEVQRNSNWINDKKRKYIEEYLQAQINRSKSHSNIHEELKPTKSSPRAVSSTHFGKHFPR